jgi:hypothetical protein
MAFERQRISSDKEILLASETDHGIARSEANQTGIGPDTNDRCIEVMPRSGIPTRPERRIERQPMLRDLDNGDPVLHESHRSFGVKKGLEGLVKVSSMLPFALWWRGEPPLFLLMKPKRDQCGLMPDIAYTQLL